MKNCILEVYTYAINSETEEVKIQWCHFISLLKMYFMIHVLSLLRKKMHMIFVHYNLFAEERTSNWNSERQQTIYITATQNSVSSPLKWEGSKKQQAKT